MSRRDWYWLSETVGVCRYGTLPEFEWIWWCPGQKTVEGVDPLPRGIDLDADFHDQIDLDWLQRYWLPGFLERAASKNWNEPHLKAAAPKTIADKAVDFLAKRGVIASRQSAQNIFVLYQRRDNKSLFALGADYATDEEVAIALSLP